MADQNDAVARYLAGLFGEAVQPRHRQWAAEVIALATPVSEAGPVATIRFYDAKHPEVISYRGQEAGDMKVFAKPASSPAGVREALDKPEIGALSFAQNYGPKVSFAGDSRSIATAKRLIDRGLISGTYQSATITDKGIAALAALSQSTSAGRVGE